MSMICVAHAAAADGQCGPGRHVGAENDGRSMSWRCVSDGPGRALSGGGGRGGGGGNPAAALAGAAAGLQGLVALLEIVDLLGSMVTETQSTRFVAVDDDPQHAAVRSAEANRMAIAYLRNGDFGQAAVQFNSAGNLAQTAGRIDDAIANHRNAQIADAEDKLLQGYLHERTGDIRAASRWYLEGKKAAERADAPELAQKLAQYNEALLARGGASGGASSNNSRCANLNGQFVCR